MTEVPNKSLTRSSQAEPQWQPPDKFRTVSLQTVAELLEASRSSARRWLKEAGISPIAVGRGAKGAIRYKWPDIKRWLQTREQVK